MFDRVDEGEDLAIEASKEKALDAITYLNERIDPAIRFYLCGYEIHFDHQYAGEIISNTSLSDFSENGIPVFENPEAVNVYVFDVYTSSRGTLPYNDDFNAVFMSATHKLRPNFFSHEMGHFFGLLHTFSNTVKRPNPFQGIFKVSITPSNSWHPTASLLTCHCCDCVSLENGVTQCFALEGGCEQEDVCDCNAHNSGDFIADTPPDPRYNDISISPDCSENNFQITDNQNMVWTYYPNRRNLMSYYFSCQNEFSGLQKDRMLQTLLTYPSRAHLINPVPVCESLVSGKVLLPRFDSDSDSYYFDPHPSADLNIYNESNDFLCGESTDITGRYLLESCYVNTPDKLVAIPEGNSDSPTEGITTQDLIKIQKHILNIELLPLPYSQIAADVSGNGAVTTLDLIRIRKLILGLTTEFSTGKWRFMPTYSLDQQWGFKTPFYTNPFGALWTYQAGDDDNIEVRSYNTPPTYFGMADVDMTNNPDILLENTWSFHAVKLGDANLSIIPNPIDGLLEGGNRLEYKFSDEGDCIEKNDKFLLRAKMVASESILGYQFTLGWDPGLLNISGIENGNTSPFSFDMFNLNDLASGQLKTSWIDIQGDSLAGNQEHHLFQLHVKSNKGFCGIDKLINIINHSTLPAEFYDTEGEIIDEVSLSFEIVPIERIHKIESVFPNPVSGQISIDYKLGAQANVDIRIFDQFGNEVTDQFAMPSGEHNYTFPSSSSLQNGALYYQITLGDEVYIGNLIKL